MYPFLAIAVDDEAGEQAAFAVILHLFNTPSLVGVIDPLGVLISSRLSLEATTSLVMLHLASMASLGVTALLFKIMASSFSSSSLTIVPQLRRLWPRP